MSEEKRRLSRREFLKSAGTAAGLGLGLAACAQPAAPAAPTSQPAAKAPAGQPATAVPTVVSAAALKEPRKLTVWMAQSFTKAADEAIKAVFMEWGQANNVQVEYDLSPSAQMIERVTPALEAGTPPDLMYLYETQTQYFRSKNALLDVTDVVNKWKDAEGGMFPAPLLNLAYDNKFWAMPVQINPWVMHTRQDLLTAAGVSYPKTWDEFYETCKKINKKPDFYAFGPCLGRNDDANTNFIHMQWCFGGRMQNEKGQLDFKSDGTLNALKYLVKLYNEELIPPGAINWDNAGNNNAYQSKQVAFVLNAPSVYAWCLANDKDLAGKTELYSVPAGPAGTFAFVDSWAIGAFKATKSPTLAKEALSYFLDPKNYVKFIVAAEGRSVPVFKNLMNIDLWKGLPKYKEWKNIAETGRVMSYNFAPTPGLSDVMEARTIAEMVQHCVVDKWAPEKALDEATKAMEALYKKYS